MITQELKDKWVAALRSGDYHQATGALRSQYGFCCLGVLCDVRDPSKWVDDVRTLNGGEFHIWTYEYVDGESLIYNEMRAEMPITQQLIGMNDQGKSFAVIADYIETNLNV